MTRGAWITRVVKPLLYLAGLGPLAWIGLALATGRVDGDQVKFIQHVTGTTVLVSLFLTLSVTPLRRLTGLNDLVKVRRLIGLTAFWYAGLHLLSYLVFDHALSPADIGDDIAEHPWVLVGFASFLLLVPLAVTSTQGWVRRLGGKWWQRLHRLVYAAAIGGVLHYLWLVKQDLKGPVYFAVTLTVILACRVWVARVGRAVTRSRGASRSQRPKPSSFAARQEDLA